MQLNCLWHSKHPGENPEKAIDYTTKVSFNDKYYLYSDDPKTVKTAWETQEKFTWDQTDQEDGTTTLHANSNKDKEKLVWIAIAVLSVIVFVLFVTSKKIPGYGFTPILMFLYSLYSLNNLQLKKTEIPGLEDSK